MTPLLQVENLSLQIPGKPEPLELISDIHFSLHEGEAIGLVGESGCGKSTLAKTLIRLLNLQTAHIQGQVLFQGKNLLSLSDKQMQKIRGKEIAMIFQDPMTSLNPTVKIGAQILEGYFTHHPSCSKQEALSYAEHLLEQVGIADPKQRLSAYPHMLSGGTRQKAMIASAIACNPKLLIADEPTTALDVTIQAQILSLLKTFQQTHKTSLLLITHDLSVIAGFCDRVLVMYGGKIIESAPVGDLFKNPKHPYTKKLLQAIPDMDFPKHLPLTTIEGTPPSPHAKPLGCSFCPRCPDARNICLQKVPPLSSLTAVHQARCWLLEKAHAPLS